MTVRLLIFAKAPIPGEVKTRLIPALGADGAAALARKMLEWTLAEAKAAAIGPVELVADPEPEDPSWSELGDLADAVSWQGEGDLGARLDRSARRCIDKGESVLLIGSDCPELDRVRLRQAADRLAGHDAFLQPAADGGYVLLGLRRYHFSLFSGIAWSEASVARETLQRIERLGWPFAVGETLNDIDRPGDLERLPPRP